MNMCLVEDVEWGVVQPGLNSFLYFVVYIDAVGSRGREILVKELFDLLLELQGGREGG